MVTLPQVALLSYWLFSVNYRLTFGPLKYTVILGINSFHRKKVHSLNL